MRQMVELKISTQMAGAIQWTIPLIHSSKIDMYTNTIDIHANTIDIHTNTIDIHTNTIDIHTNTFDWLAA